MRKVLVVCFLLLPAVLIGLSCGSSPSSTSGKTSGLKYRAFLSNSVSAGTGSAGVFIVDAQNDVRANVAPLTAGNTPGLMAVTPNRAQTVVFSGSGTLSSDNQLTFINNAAETSSNHLTLPGMTESIVISPDSSAAYVAVPTAPVIGAPPGAVKAVGLGSATFSGEVDIPSVHYLSMNNGGDRIFGFSDNSDQIVVITPSNIGISNAVTYIGGTGVFDRPVAAFFSADDNTAYVLSCGAECGGTQAGVQQFNLANNTLVASVPVCAPGIAPVQCGGSVALMNGSTLYVAGTPYTNGAPSQPCTGQTTAAVNCGLLTVINLSSMTVENGAPIVITDGYHNRIAMGANGQLFIGARTCTEIIPPVPPPQGAETRGCLSIYNTLTTAVGGVAPGGVLIPAVNGDVTGIQPVSTRNVVYLVQGQQVQGGTLYIYDTTIDALENNPHDPNNPGKIFGLVGNFYDVKTIDF